VLCELLRQIGIGEEGSAQSDRIRLPGSDGFVSIISGVSIFVTSTAWEFS